MIKIGIDASGGDNGEAPVVSAVIDAISRENDIKFFVFGKIDTVKEEFKKHSVTFPNDKIEIVDAKEKIEMNDHPVFALRSKPDSSIFLAGKSLINHDIDIFISAGSTGALVALSQFYLKPLEGIDRPVVAAIIPTKHKPMLLIDSGCNVDSKPEWLYQYAILGDVYIKAMLGIKSPRIGLLSVGTEENKGNTLTLSAYKLINENKNLNFIGNVEARDVPEGICDILVTDGFAGNVFLKTYEGTAKMLFSEIKKTLLSNAVAKVGALLIKPTLKSLLHKFDAKIYGGAPILGARYIVLKCHGNAKVDEYSYAIKQAKDLVLKDITKMISDNIGG